MTSPETPRDPAIAATLFAGLLHSCRIEHLTEAMGAALARRAVDLTDTLAVELTRRAPGLARAASSSLARAVAASGGPPIDESASIPIFDVHGEDTSP